ncbi:hypothetical protein EX30DRAFT_339066, partial [Ascodesmis nigricans]
MSSNPPPPPPQARRITKPGPPPQAPKPKFTPTQYKSTQRKVQSIIIALPIALVTSWVLYDRLYLGTERKKFEAPAVEGIVRKD